VGYTQTPTATELPLVETSPANPNRQNHLFLALISEITWIRTLYRDRLATALLLVLMEAITALAMQVSMTVMMRST
jgi:hypothetical protein